MTGYGNEKFGAEMWLLKARICFHVLVSTVGRFE